MHRLPIFQDSRSFDERTEKLMRDVRRQIDEDLQSFGFGRKKLLTPSTKLGWSDDDDESPTSSLLSHDFFKLRPSTKKSTSASRLSSPPPKKEDFGSRESLDEDTTKQLFVERPQQEGRLFCMSFDVKEFEAEDISVTVEDDALIVQAKRRTEKDGAVSVKEFNRKIKLPKDVDPEKLVSTMTSDGILTIEAQVPPEYEEAVAAGASAAGDGLNGSATSASASSPTSPTSPTSSKSLSQRTAPSIPLDTPTFSDDPSSGRRRMELILEVGNPYTPDDISVKLEGRKLIVEATHEEKWQGRTSKVSMQRDFDLSEDIDVSSVQALLRSTGQLTITAFAQ